jgi:hypothetical protein
MTSGVRLLRSPLSLRGWVPSSRWQSLLHICSGGGIACFLTVPNGRSVGCIRYQLSMTNAAIIHSCQQWSVIIPFGIRNRFLSTLDTRTPPPCVNRRTPASWSLASKSNYFRNTAHTCQFYFLVERLNLRSRLTRSHSRSLIF